MKLSNGGRTQEFQQNASECGRWIETLQGVFIGSSVLVAHSWDSNLVNYEIKMVMLKVPFLDITPVNKQGKSNIIVSAKRNKKYLCIFLTNVVKTGHNTIGQLLAHGVTWQGLYLGCLSLAGWVIIPEFCSVANSQWHGANSWVVILRWVWRG